MRLPEAASYLCSDHRWGMGVMSGDWGEGGGGMMGARCCGRGNGCCWATTGGDRAVGGGRGGGCLFCERLEEVTRKKSYIVNEIRKSANVFII